MVIGGNIEPTYVCSNVAITLVERAKSSVVLVKGTDKERLLGVILLRINNIGSDTEQLARRETLGWMLAIVSFLSGCFHPVDYFCLFYYLI